MNSSNNFFQLVAEFQKNIDWLNQILLGDESETVLIDGVVKPSISKDIEDKWQAIKAMMQGRQAYATKSAMDSDLNHPENTLAEVWNDPTLGNNGLYGKVGAAGAGSWVQSSGDLATQAYQIASDNAPKVANNTAQNVSASNIVTNGHFTNDTTGWNLQRWNTVAAVNGHFEGESSGFGGFSYIRQYPDLIEGHSYYFSVKGRAPNDCILRVIIGDATLDKNIQANTWVRSSGVVVAGTKDEALFGFFGTQANAVYNFDSIVLLDLTFIFGAGHEPDVLDVDAILSGYPDYFFDEKTTLVGAKDIVPLFSVNKASRLNVTTTFPLSSGYYTKKTAREAIPPSRRSLGLKLTYQIDRNTWFEDQFIGDDLADWLSSSEWLSSTEKIDLNRPSESHGVKDAESYFSIAKYMDGVYASNFYIEVVMLPEKQHDPEISYLFDNESPTAGVYLRRRFTTRYEFCVYDGDGVRHILSAEGSLNKPIHMCLFVIDGVASLYADGVFVSDDTLSNGVNPAGYSLRFLEPTSLFRVGATNTPNALERFNNGKPLDYMATDAVVEFKTDGITLQSYRENVSGEYFDYDHHDAILIDSMYPSEIKGTGAPNFRPQFVRQKYFDTTNNVDYVARGRAQVSDWCAIATSKETDNKQDTLVSGTNIKTINNVSVLGSGNITVGDGGVSIQTKEFENITAYGAVTNGVVDATEAIEKAVAASEKSGYPVMLSGICRIIRGIIAKNNVHFIAAPGAKLVRDVAVTQSITEDMVVGQTFVKVEDGSQYRLGEEINIIISPSLAPGAITYGYINQIDGNTLHFDSREGYAGSQQNYKVSQGVKVTTAFSMITSNATIDTVNNTIDGIELITNPQPTDPDYYFLAPIHFNAASAETTVQNTKINGSNGDGISLQGRDKLQCINNKLPDIKQNAIHFGTTAEEVLVDLNSIERAGRNCVFWCYNNKKVIVTRNHFKDSNLGCGEIDYADRESIIDQNTFDNCLLGVMINGGSSIGLGTNFFINMDGDSVGIDVTRSVDGALNLGSPIFKDFKPTYTGDCIKLANAKVINIPNLIVKGGVGPGSAVNLDDENGICEQVIITSANIDGEMDNGITAKNTKNCLIANSIIKVKSGGTPINKVGTNVGLVDTPNILIN